MYKRESLGKKCRRRFFKLGKWLGITVVGVLIAGYGYVRYDFLSHADTLDAELATARSYGLPLDPSAMDRFHTIPIEQNAAPHYATAFSKMEKLRDAKDFIEPDPLLLSTDQQSREIYRASIARMRPINSEIRIASKLPDFALEKNWGDTWKVLFPEYAGTRYAAKWLGAEALLAAVDGDWNLANANLAAIGKLSYHAGRDKVLIGGLVSVAIGAIGLRTATQLGEIAGDDVSQLNRLKATVAAMPEAPPLQPYLEGEAFMGYWTMSRLSENVELLASNFDSIGGPSLIDKWMIMPPLIEPEVVQNANSAELLHYWNAVFRLIHEDKVPSMQLGAKMDRFVTELDANLKPWMKWSAIFYPVFAQAGQALARLDANKACTLAMIDTLVYKARNGRLPSNLKEAGAKTAETFGDGKLRYVVSNAGFRIYSVGPDLIGEGGRARYEAPRNNQHQSDDMVVGYPDSQMHERYNVESAKKQLLETIKRAKNKAKPALHKASPPRLRYIQ